MLGRTKVGGARKARPYVARPAERGRGPILGGPGEAKVACEGPARPTRDAAPKGADRAGARPRGPRTPTLEVADDASITGRGRACRISAASPMQATSEAILLSIAALPLLREVGVTATPAAAAATAQEGKGATACRIAPAITASLARIAPTPCCRAIARPSPLQDYERASPAGDRVR